VWYIPFTSFCNVVAAAKCRCKQDQFFLQERHSRKRAAQKNEGVRKKEARAKKTAASSGRGFVKIVMQRQQRIMRRRFRVSRQKNWSSRNSPLQLLPLASKSEIGAIKSLSCVWNNTTNQWKERKHTTISNIEWWFVEIPAAAMRNVYLDDHMMMDKDNISVFVIQCQTTNKRWRRYLIPGNGWKNYGQGLRGTWEGREDHIIRQRSQT